MRMRRRSSWPEGDRQAPNGGAVVEAQAQGLIGHQCSHRQLPLTIRRWAASGDLRGPAKSHSRPEAALRCRPPSGRLNLSVSSQCSSEALGAARQFCGADGSLLARSRTHAHGQDPTVATGSFRAIHSNSLRSRTDNVGPAMAIGATRCATTWGTATASSAAFVVIDFDLSGRVANGLQPVARRASLIS